MNIQNKQITVLVNNEQRSVSRETRLIDLISELDLLHKRIAVEINLEVVSRSVYDAIFLNDGDRVEIIHAIGGG